MENWLSTLPNWLSVCIQILLYGFIILSALVLAFKFNDILKSVDIINKEK